MRKRPSRETVEQRFAAHDARTVHRAAHPEPAEGCPHCARIIAATGSLTIRPEVVAELDHLLATAKRVTMTGLTRAQKIAALTGEAEDDPWPATCLPAAWEDDRD